MSPPNAPAVPPPLPSVQDFLDHAHARRVATALDAVSRHMAHGGTVTEVVRDLLAPAQREVGRRWQIGAWTVADEHAASAIVEDALGVLATHLPRSSGSQRVTVVCAEGEWHVTPARMAALVLRDAGWRVDFLGASVPLEHLRSALRHTRPHVLAISATLPLSLAGVPTMVEAAHAADVPVIVGGAAFDREGHRARVLEADGHARDLATAAGMLTGWLDRPPTRPMGRAQPQWRREHRSLHDHHDELVEAAFRMLGQRMPAMRAFTPEQLEHTRKDLGYSLQFLRTAMLVEDPGLFADYTRWLIDVLVHRGVPAGAVASSYEVLSAVLDADLRLSRSMLATAAAAARDAAPRRTDAAGAP